MIRIDGQDDLVLDQRDKGEVGPFDGGTDETDVTFAGQHLLHHIPGIGNGDFGLDLGIARLEVAQQLRQDKFPRRGAGGDHEFPAYFLFDVTQPLKHLLMGCYDLLGEGQKLLPGGRQRDHPPLASDQQFRAQLSFQPFDLIGNRWLADAQSAGCLR